MSLLIWILLGIQAGASTLEQEYLNRLSHARKNEIEALQDRFERIRMLRLACSLQIREKQVPASCYEAMKEEAQWNLRTPAQALSLTAELDERCRHSAGTLSLPPAQASLRSLSGACATAVNEARKIQAYRAQEKIWSEN